MMNENLKIYIRMVCMGIFSLSLISLLVPYIMVDQAKNTMLGKLMKSYCCLSLLGVLAHFVYTLMEFVIPVTSEICGLIMYFLIFCYYASLMSRVLFLFHICYIFYNSYKMILKDVTDEQLQKLRTGYLLSISVIPFVLVMIVAVQNYVTDADLLVENSEYCLYYGDYNLFTTITTSLCVIIIQVIGFGIIVVLSYLLYKAHRIQKNVGQDSKNLLRISLGIGAAYGITWIIYAFQPLYAPIAPIVFYSGATLDSVVIISVFFYSNKTLMRIKHCIKTATSKT